MRGFFILLCIKGITNGSFLHTEIENYEETEISDWSEAKTDGTIKVIDFLVGLDSSLTRYYNYDEAKIKSAIVTLFHTINQYFYPIDIRISVVDIVPVKGTNIGLDDFTTWKKEQRNLLSHDVTVLLRHNYEGGIAYSNGMCSKANLMISGFFPESTMNNAWVFIHQLAHIIGLTHQITTKCTCPKIEEEKCLKLRGFPACSVQEMINKLKTHKCLHQESETVTRIMAIKKSSLSICGNGLLERGEECDCGPEKFCDNILCDAVNCKFIVQKAYLTSLIPMLLALVCFAVLLVFWKCMIVRSWKSFSERISLLIRRDVDQSTNDNCHPETGAPSIVRMRETRSEDIEVPAETRRSRFSGIYVTMRPISRFWEKLEKLKQQQQQAKEGAISPI